MYNNSPGIKDNPAIWDIIRQTVQPRMESPVYPGAYANPSPNPVYSKTLPVPTTIEEALRRRRQMQGQKEFELFQNLQQQGKTPSSADAMGAALQALPREETMGGVLDLRTNTYIVPPVNIYPERETPAIPPPKVPMTQAEVNARSMEQYGMLPSKQVFKDPKTGILTNVSPEEYQRKYEAIQPQAADKPWYKPGSPGMYTPEQIARKSELAGKMWGGLPAEIKQREDLEAKNQAKRAEQATLAQQKFENKRAIVKEELARRELEGLGTPAERKTEKLITVLENSLSKEETAAREKYNAYLRTIELKNMQLDYAQSEYDAATTDTEREDIKRRLFIKYGLVPGQEPIGVWDFEGYVQQASPEKYQKIQGLRKRLDAEYKKIIDEEAEPTTTTEKQAPMTEQELQNAFGSYSSYQDFENKYKASTQYNTDKPEVRKYTLKMALEYFSKRR